jgi:hypothetical protein
MLPFLPLHTLAAQRGDGLRSELLALFKRHVGLETGLAIIIEPVETELPCEAVDVVPKVPVAPCVADESSAEVLCRCEGGPQEASPG